MDERLLRQCLSQQEAIIRELRERISELENIVEDICRTNKEICPHRFEWNNSVGSGEKTINTYVCSICGKVHKEVISKVETANDEPIEIYHKNF